MSKRPSNEPRPRRSPTQTVANYSDEFVEELNLPELPSGIPQRLEEAIVARVDALLYRLREAKQKRYVRTLEVRLVRDAHRAVLTAYELGLRDAEVWYATFRELTEALGYERVDVGFAKVRDA